MLQDTAHHKHDMDPDTVQSDGYLGSGREEDGTRKFVG